MSFQLGKGFDSCTVCGDMWVGADEELGRLRSPVQHVLLPPLQLVRRSLPLRPSSCATLHERNRRELPFLTIHFEHDPF